MVRPPESAITPVLAPPDTPTRQRSEPKAEMLGAIADGTGIPLYLIVVSALKAY
jgi:hypothetical protein